MKRSNRPTNKINKTLILGLSIFGFILLGIFVYRQLLSPSTVALITEESGVIQQCTSNIATFTTQGSCSNGFVQSVSYACKFDDKKGYEGKLGTCVDPQLAFQHAQAYCGQTCLEGRTPEPSKSPVSTAYPTLTPTPSRSPSITETSVPAPSISTMPSPSSSPKPVATAATICPLSLSKWAYREACGKDQYRYVDYACSGDSTMRILGSSTECKTSSTWLAEARTSCASNRCVRVTPTPIASVRPTPVPTRQPLSVCYRSCRQTTTRSIWSCYSQCRGR